MNPSVYQNLSRHSPRNPQCLGKESRPVLIMDFDNLSKPELVDEVIRLTAHVAQLRNVIAKRKNPNEDQKCPAKKSKKSERQFDFSKHPKRHVALKIAYLGWDLLGLAAQEDNDETVEAHIFDALMKTKLIENRQTSNYHRCGRTDKGVSAFSQVFSIDLRCKSTTGLGVIEPFEPTLETPTKVCNLEDELDYCGIINRVLPKEIRILAWSPVKPDFSARFNCISRTYRYYFPITKELDIENMKKGSEFLIGEHDFRNFCKLDGDKTTMRRIISIQILQTNSPLLMKFEIQAQSFLWHQIRCIVSVLLHIGKGLEHFSIVSQLLDVISNPKKPQYGMASDFPLNLFDVDHGEEVDWRFSQENLQGVYWNFEAIWMQHAIKCQMIREMMGELPFSNAPESNSADSLIFTTRIKNYKKFLDRPVCNPNKGQP